MFVKIKFQHVLQAGRKKGIQFALDKNLLSDILFQDHSCLCYKIVCEILNIYKICCIMFRYYKYNKNMI